MTENTVRNNSCEILYTLIQTRLSEASMDWMKTIILFENAPLFFKNARLISLIPSISQVSGKIVLEELYPSLTFGQWNLQQFCRCLFVIYIPEDQNITVIKKLIQSTDINEHICICQYQSILMYRTILENNITPNK